MSIWAASTCTGNAVLQVRVPRGAQQVGEQVPGGDDHSAEEALAQDAGAQDESHQRRPGGALQALGLHQQPCRDTGRAFGLHGHVHNDRVDRAGGRQPFPGAPHADPHQLLLDQDAAPLGSSVILVPSTSSRPPVTKK